MDRNEENFFHQSFLSVTELCQQHNIIGKNESVLSPKLSVFGRQIGPKLKKLEKFF